MSKWDITREFWEQKLEEYAVILRYRRIDEKANPKAVMNDLIEKFTQTYGEENVEKEIGTSIYRRKEYEYWHVRIYFLGKEKDPDSYFSISHNFLSLEEYIYHISNISTWHTRRIYTARLDELIALINKYIEDYQENQNQLNSKILEFEKNEKFKDTARKSIKAIVEAKMRGTSYQWNLTEEETRCVLCIKMKRSKMIEITLGYKSFTDKIPEMLEVIKQMENLLETIPYPVNIRSYGKNIEWGR